MEYIVTIKQGSDEVSFKFTDSIRANMFAEMAAKNIVPDTYYGSDEVKQVKITMAFEPVKAEEPQEAPKAEDNTEKEAE